LSTPTDQSAVTRTEPETLLTYREAVNLALDEAMAADSSILLMGEDVANEGGVFKTNGGLAEKYGRRRVLNTPICENGFLGAALGMSLMGLRPIAEIMFSDFLPTAGDAIINQIAKYRFMTAGECTVPVTIRAIGGGTGRFGTQHSATGESWFMGFPGLRVASAGTPGGIYEVLSAAIRSNDPVLVFEHKGLYLRKGVVRPGTRGNIGQASVIRAGKDITIAATLLMLDRALAAAELLEAGGISAEVIDIRWLRPLDTSAIKSSFERTGRLLLVEEEVHGGGWAATVVSLLAQSINLAGRLEVLSLRDDVLMPYSPTLEDQMIPSAEAIAASARRVTAG
jgi:pyruvate/2-oxoglutarate/acetoin dehydrogenase E1 component